MDKTKPDKALSCRPIAKKVPAEMKLHWRRKVVDIKNVIAGRTMAEEQKTVVSQKKFAGFDPAHAAHVYDKLHLDGLLRDRVIRWRGGSEVTFNRTVRWGITFGLTPSHT